MAKRRALEARPWTLRRVIGWGSASVDSSLVVSRGIPSAALGRMITVGTDAFKTR